MAHRPVAAEHRMPRGAADFRHLDSNHSGAVHPTAIVGGTAEWLGRMSFYAPLVGARTIIRPHATVDAGCERRTTIGDDCLIATGVYIAHDCQIGDGVQIAAHAVLGGLVTIGDDVKIGLNATIIPRVTIGAGARIGAGAVVLTDVPAGEVWAGNPARPLHDPDAAIIRADMEEFAARARHPTSRTLDR